MCVKSQNIKSRLLSTLLLCHAFIALTAWGASVPSLDCGGSWEHSVHKKDGSQRLQTHQDEVLLPDGQAAEYHYLQMYSGSCTFPSVKLQAQGKRCQHSLFILMNAVLKQMATKQEVCLFICWVNRLHWSQIALFSTQWNKSTYLEETSAIPHFVFSDQEIPAIIHNYHSTLLIKYQNLLTNKMRCGLFSQWQQLKIGLSYKGRREWMLHHLKSLNQETVFIRYIFCISQ